MPRPVLPALLCFSTILFASACGAPPNKEMDQAQGAIDAARAAGAEQYATAEYAAATASLKSAHDAAAAGDYRLALNHALSSHERAQNAARETADSKARMRADVERGLAQVDAQIAQAQARLESARARTPRRLLSPVEEQLAAIDADLQKAREAAGTGDYVAANAALEGVRERVEGVLAAVTDATAQSSRRRR